MSDSRGELLEKNVKIIGENNTPVTIKSLISDKGGQGDVYLVNYRGNDYAMKWYCKHPDDVSGGAQYSTISKIYGEKNKPSNRFIWPLFMVTEENPAKGKRFGYLMNLLPQGYKEMEDYLRKDADPKAARFKSYNAMLVAGMGIAKAMQDLHMKGWSYKDLNPKNFAINPESGDVLVVDNDNVSVDGDLCSVKGMRGYMAPEIPRSNYKLNPSMETDRYSLAVVLYRLFFVDHPMEGKAWEKYPLCTEKVEDYLYAIKPIFHFNPKDDSNRPTSAYAPNVSGRWKADSLFSKELRDTFITALTDGVEKPEKRLPELEWISVLSKTRDRLIRRSNPERERFVNFENRASIPNGCLAMKIGSKCIALYPQKAIYEFTITGDTKQYAKVDGGIVYDKRIDRLALRNLTDQIWRCYSPKTKQLTDLSKGQEFPLEPGVAIEFHRENPKIIGEIFDPLKK